MEKSRKDTRWLKGGTIWAIIISVMAYFTGLYFIYGLAVLSLIIGLLAFLSGRNYNNPKQNS